VLLEARFLVFALVTLVCVASAPADSQREVRWRKYNVRHPVYPADHPIWGTERRTVDVAAWVEKSNDTIRRHIDSRGARRGDNTQMLAVLHHLAHRYAQTHQPEYAYKCAVILDRYAEVIGVWPFFDREGKRTYPHHTMLKQFGIGMPPRHGGFWSSWWPYDLGVSCALALAYDQIVNSGQIEKLADERGCDVRAKIERDLLQENVNINNRYPLTYGNTQADRLVGMLIWGQALGDPELVHRAIRYGDALPKVSYFPSAFWHEGSPGYHMMITGRWVSRFPSACLESYSDPPGFTDPVDGTRFDDVDFAARYRPFLERALRQAQEWVLPNGLFAAVHDAHWFRGTSTTQASYGILDDYKPSVSRPLLHTWAGHVVLGRGRGDRQVQAHLHFSGTYGHDHKDNLNFFLWAKGAELLSETDYKVLGYRDWNGSTAAHNTVVVDERNQLTRSSAPQREFTEIDDLPGVEDFWFARTRQRHGTCLTDGMLRLLVDDCPGVQAVEADGHRAYPSDLVRRYRRTIVMVDVDEEDVYVVDIFRVGGGSVHDWMLHGPLHDDYTTTTSLPLAPRGGTLHRYLNELRSVATDGPWWIEFATPSGNTVRTTMMPAPGTEVILGKAPGIRRQQPQTFLDVRRAGPDSVFVAVHEPYATRRKLRSVEVVAPQKASEAAVMLKVTWCGRTDYILSTLAEEGIIQTDDLLFRGHFAYLSVAGGTYRTRYMADASLLRTGDAELRTAAAYLGDVTDTLSTARGAPLNAFVTDALLPASGLEGKLLLTTDGDGSTRGFRVRSVARHGDRTLIEVDRIPGMTIEEGYVKQQYFPNWGIPGGLSFRILNSRRGSE